MGDQPGLTNFYKVSDQLYRGAQPGDEGFDGLKAVGVRTVVNLRAFHADSDACTRAGLECLRIPVQTWDVEQKEVVEFLKVIVNPENQPVFLHCQHGADRTGLMTAAYRIAVQGWSKEDAIREMTEGGFGFHPIWQNLVRDVRNLDVPRIKELAGIKNGSGGDRRPGPTSR